MTVVSENIKPKPPKELGFFNAELKHRPQIYLKVGEVLLCKH